jgi:holo-[acyl-carrier protein] synthase
MLGTDVVDVDRLRRALARDPDVEGRLFTPEESGYCRAKPDPIVSFAGTLAAKEAVMKAAGLGSLPAWARRIEIRRGSDGSPRVSFPVKESDHFEISISHDGGVAVAVALRF